MSLQWVGCGQINMYVQRQYLTQPRNYLPMAIICNVEAPTFDNCSITKRKRN